MITVPPLRRKSGGQWSIQLRVERRIDRRHPDECWKWLGHKNVAGYGTIRIRGTKASLAHRIVYEFLRGPIPEGLTLDHLCRVRDCVNPAHLEPVTWRENIARGESFREKLRTHCPHGHLLNNGNLSRFRLPYRECLTCRRRMNRKSYQQNKQRHLATVRAYKLRNPVRVKTWGKTQNEMRKARRLQSR